MALSQLAWAHETLLWASKSKGARYTFNYDLINGPDPTSQVSFVWHLPAVLRREKSHGRHLTQKLPSSPPPRRARFPERRRAGLRPILRVWNDWCCGQGCARTSSETSNKKEEQGSSPQATEAGEVARCEGRRTIKVRPEPRSDVWDMTKKVDFTTYDPRGCPKGGLLSGTDKKDNLAGRDSDEEIRGLGAEDYLIGGLGNDAIYSGPGSDRLADWPLAGWWGGGGCGGALPFEQRICREVSVKAGGDDVLYGGDGDDELGSEKGEDILYGGDGNDYVFDEVRERERDQLYGGKGEDVCGADKNDYVDSSCERTLDEVYAEGPN